MSFSNSQATRDTNGSITSISPALKMVCALATWRAVEPPSQPSRSANGPVSGTKIVTAMSLKRVWAAATRRASMLAPAAASSAVPAVPTLAP